MLHKLKYLGQILFQIFSCIEWQYLAQIKKTPLQEVFLNKKAGPNFSPPPLFCVLPVCHVHPDAPGLSTDPDLSLSIVRWVFASSKGVLRLICYLHHESESIRKCSNANWDPPNLWQKTLWHHHGHDLQLSGKWFFHSPMKLSAMKISSTHLSNSTFPFFLSRHMQKQHSNVDACPYGWSNNPPPLARTMSSRLF